MLSTCDIATVTLVASLALTTGCIHGPTSSRTAPPPVPGHVRTMFSMRYVEVQPGPETSALAAPGKCYYVHYTGWLTDGTKFDSSRDTTPDGKPRMPLVFLQGARQVIAGWDAGFEGMRVGGRRRLIIPYQLAYGEKGRGPIPPKANLIFDVELMDVRDAPPATRPPEPPPRCPSWDQRGSNRS